VVSYIVKGKTELFSVIIDRYQSKVFSTAFHYTHDQEEARDLTQEIFIKLYNNLQKYKGKADWSRIIEAKKRFGQLTIFGSGDVLDAETAVQRLAESGLDGVIIARGAVGNPWIFQEIRALFSGQQKPPSPSLAEQGQIMLEHFEMICQSRPERKAVPYFRKFLAGYCRRHPERKKVLLALMACKSRQAVIDTIRQLYCLH